MSESKHSSHARPELIHLWKRTAWPSVAYFLWCNLPQLARREHSMWLKQWNTCIWEVDTGGELNCRNQGGQKVFTIASSIKNLLLLSPLGLINTYDIPTQARRYFSEIHLYTVCEELCHACAENKIIAIWWANCNGKFKIVNFTVWVFLKEKEQNVYHNIH